jgi:hypothetical protein
MGLSGYDLKRMDEEDTRLLDELSTFYENRERPTADKLLGFKLAESRCFITPLPCRTMVTQITSLIPLYETVIMPIYPQYQDGIEIKKIVDDVTFRKVNYLTPTELATLAEKGRVLPYFTNKYTSFDEKTIRPLLQPGLPRVSPGTMLLIRWAASDLTAEDKDLEESEKLATKDLKSFTQRPKNKMESKCAQCLALCYMLGMRKRFQEAELGQVHACFVSYAVSANYLDAVLQAKCLFAKNVMGDIGGLPEGVDINYVLKGLKLDYSPDLPLEEYIEVFDSKTSKALRRIFANLLSDPLSSKYTDRLSNKIYDLNREVKELAASKVAKVYETVSDMALYGGRKFIESQTQKYIQVPKKGFMRLSDWLASKGIDLAAKAKGKDWSIAQLYKAQCKLERCH